MNISEASATADVLHAITATEHPELRGGPDWADEIAKALHFLNERASKTLQLTIVTDAEIEIAARQIAQRAADAT